MSIDKIHDFLLWSTVINFGLLLFSVVMIITTKNFIYRLHGKIFNLEKEQITLSLYLVLGIYKILIIVFNIVPLIAIEIIK